MHMHREMVEGAARCGPANPRGESMSTLDETRLLTAAELAERLKVKPDTVRLWARQGKIPARKLSHKILRFNLADVVATLETRQCPEGRRVAR
jgi:excisionase family DNA binding protein